MLEIWGRRSSSNVQALMWCVQEIQPEYVRRDAGFSYGMTDTDAFAAINPNRTVPVLRDEGALAFLRPEDQLVVWKVDRLGRSLREMLDTAHKLQEQVVRLRTLTEAIDTETSTGRLMFNFLGTIAEYFLDLNRERTIEGLKAAAARGRKGRRPRNLSEDDLTIARALLKDPSIPVAQIARRLDVSRATFYAYFPHARARSLSGALRLADLRGRICSRLPHPHRAACNMRHFYRLELVTGLFGVCGVVSHLGADRNLGTELGIGKCRNSAALDWFGKGANPCRASVQV